MGKRAFLILGLTAGILAAPVAQADVSVNINVGPPPVVLVSPPALVVVPGSPVYYAPGVAINLFVYGGRYYSFHNGAWFHAATHRGPWVLIAVAQVPAPVIAVPVAYYRVPPGQAKKLGAGPGPRGCPPGLAKQGRC